jgi:hypothetical protein
MDCIRWCSLSFVRARLCWLMRPHWFVHARLFKFVRACSGSFVRSMCTRLNGAHIIEWQMNDELEKMCKEVAVA